MCVDNDPLLILAVWRFCPIKSVVLRLLRHWLCHNIQYKNCNHEEQLQSEWIFLLACCFQTGFSAKKTKTERALVINWKLKDIKPCRLVFKIVPKLVMMNPFALHNCVRSDRENTYYIRRNFDLLTTCPTCLEQTLWSNKTWRFELRRPTAQNGGRWL